MVPVTLQYIPTIYEGYFGYCRYIPRIYGNAYTVTWLVPKFRRFHLSEICGGYRTSGHKTDIVNHIPDIILDSLITYLVYSFVQEYTKYITVLWQNIYKYIYIYMSGILKTIFHFQVTGAWPQMVIRKDIKCAILSPHFCTWPPFSFCRLRLARTVVLSKNASHLDYFVCAEHLGFPIHWCFVWNKNEVLLPDTRINHLLICRLVSLSWFSLIWSPAPF